jgi:hypothetical protein
MAVGAKGVNSSPLEAPMPDMLRLFVPLVTPEKLADRLAKKTMRMRRRALEAEFNEAHAQGMDALSRHDLRAFDAAVKREAKAIDEFIAHTGKTR